MSSSQCQYAENVSSHSKEHCHTKIGKLYDDVEILLKPMSETHDTTMRTAKAFTQVDAISNNTETLLSKMNKAINQLSDEKWNMTTTLDTLKDIERSLDIDTIAKTHWTAIQK
ncbi:hypothetical protein BDF20DRAFT_838118 [Mycotypha africana]|uniref:uncharacterized protein n=1 Tax=Mycotypha africana TaxID=64632 RepID=UPI0023002975|nr:uncharacterized protein BDF20DRAFT_838118 [Mycotypha africana]KAI8971838.1 hypothetical protein BDF20DRAFT_838118 [Mycotypha africana]